MRANTHPNDAMVWPSLGRLRDNRSDERGGPERAKSLKRRVKYL
ncbi:hypothetical protein IMCC12053_1063 [Celeribacter marinus]|uniref:Uncharacterized protein n=1 Tax=Celeribacter marinus TaxID=1397108 RepID=A0A0N9ZF19_9RHOB|nr:hypothetical protein IMCC12053_1063 [Celeribacter marinus]